MNSLLIIHTNDKTLNRALRIAIGDICGNITPYKDGLIESASPCVMAGLDYDTPWTRDTAINVWNGLGLVFPEVSKNTLLSVLKRVADKVFIGGQYWDCIIWTIGAWQYYLCTEDKEFLSLAYEASLNSMKYYEENEFSEDYGLFRGPACYGDGVAAYPDIYALTGGSSEILEWKRHNPDKISQKGYGIPMHALSTNCLYYGAYITLESMEKQLCRQPSNDWYLKAKRLRESINSRFWDDKKKNYKYLVDKFGECDHQEGLGNALAVLLGVANEEISAQLFDNTYSTPNGIPCVWPSFDRYMLAGMNTFGRHSGTVWPHIQGFWADAAARFGRIDILKFEMGKLAAKICRDKQCAEIYHPMTGEIYGGLQESEGKGIVEWDSCSRQTWSATALLRMVLSGIAGIRMAPDGIWLNPVLPDGIHRVIINHLLYKGSELNITIEGPASEIAEFSVNGKKQKDNLIIPGPEKIIDVKVKFGI